MLNRKHCCQEKETIRVLDVNTYNPDVLREWKANVDLQYILDPYACVMYIAAYILCSRVSGQWGNY